MHGIKDYNISVILTYNTICCRSKLYIKVNIGSTVNLSLNLHISSRTRDPLIKAWNFKKVCRDFIYNHQVIKANFETGGSGPSSVSVT